MMHVDAEGEGDDAADDDDGDDIGDDDDHDDDDEMPLHNNSTHITVTCCLSKVFQIIKQSVSSLP